MVIKKAIYVWVIGLMLVWKLVRLHKGKINLSSVENQGSVIKVSFPKDSKRFRKAHLANSAMQRKDVENAKRYLQKGGDSPEALYARGVYAFLVEDYTVARKQLNEAKNKGVQQAEIILLEIDKIDK